MKIQNRLHYCTALIPTFETELEALSKHYEPLNTNQDEGGL